MGHRSRGRNLQGAGGVGFREAQETAGQSGVQEKGGVYDELRAEVHKRHQGC